MKLQASIVAALVVAGLLACWRWEVVTSERDRLERDLALAVRRVSQLDAERALLDAGLAARDKIDHETRQELRHAKAEIDDLRRGVVAGTAGLLVRAQCPAASDGVPSAASAPGMADGAAIELAADARPDYFALRDELATDKAKILGLQNYIREVCRPHQ